MTNGPWKKKGCEKIHQYFPREKLSGPFFSQQMSVLIFPSLPDSSNLNKKSTAGLGLKRLSASYYLPHTDSLSGVRGSRIGQHWAMQPALWTSRLYGKEEGWKLFLLLQEIQCEKAKHPWCCKSWDTLSSTGSVCRDANKGMTFQAHLYLSCRT